MVPNPMRFRAASALTAVGIVLALANWYVKPDAALAWTAALVMFVVMIAALRVSRRAVRHPMVEAMAVRNLDQTTSAVVFAALMMGISLALSVRQWLEAVWLIQAA